MDKSDSSEHEDQWLTSLFATAADPFVDTAFVERVLKRLRRKARIRLYVILGTSTLAAALTLWLAHDVVAVPLEISLPQLALPGWSSFSGSALVTTAIIISGLAAWFVAEES